MGGVVWSYGGLIGFRGNAPFIGRTLAECYPFFIADYVECAAAQSFVAEALLFFERRSAGGRFR